MDIFVVVISLLFLIVLHELGHFLTAKKFGVKVEEFGIGLPPRAVGKKIGETVYSLNVLPLGAFVRLAGEEGGSPEPRSFRAQSLAARALIVGGGVMVFWIVAAILFTMLGVTSGIPMGIGDEQERGFTHAQVRITGVAQNSPASAAGIRAGDTVKKFGDFDITKVGQLQELIKEFKGREITLTIQRGKQELQVRAVPRKEPAPGEGSLGVALTRTALVKFSPLQAPFQGLALTGTTTVRIGKELANLAGDLIGGRGIPPGVEVTGPIGIVQLLRDSLSFGLPSFFSFLAVLSIYLAIFNVLPIPVVDGGKLLFLGIEFVRRRPIPEKLEQRINTVSFGVLILLLLWVTVRDVSRLF